MVRDSGTAVRTGLPMRRSFAGFGLDRPLVMGIVNVTPDSFSDGGRFFAAEAAIAHGHALIAEGADILDIGGESTRPGAPQVPPEEEQARILPVIAALAPTGVCISVDTRHAATMRMALGAGARVINDITALTGDAASLDVAAAWGAGVVLMHMQGSPQTMQVDPRYGDVVAEIRAYLAARVTACRAAGIPDDRIAVDPGIGFGKTLDHNLALLAGLDSFATLGVAVLVGASRKSFLGRLGGGAPADRRLGGSVAAALAAAARGADILRVHDVGETVQALAVWRAIAAVPPALAGAARLE